MDKSFKINLNFTLLVILIITGGIYTFGITWAWIEIPTPFFTINESFIIIIWLLISGLIIKRVKIRYNKTVMKYYVWFFIWLLFEALKNIVLRDAGISEVIQKFRYNYLILLIFPMATLINTPKKLFRLFNLLMYISLITSIIYVFQFLTGISLAASSANDSSGIYRISNPGVVISAVAIQIAFAKLIEEVDLRKNFIFYAIGLFGLAVAFLSISRGYIFGILGGIFFALLVNAMVKRSMSMFFRFIYISIFAGVFFFFTYNSLDFDTDVFYDRMEEGVEDIFEGEGSYNTRTEMIIEKISVIAEENPLMGVGFAYYETEDKEERKTTAYYVHPYALNGDSTIQNIVIVGGFVGLILWIMLQIYPVIMGVRYYRRSANGNYRALYLALTSSVIFIFLHSFSSNYFSTAGFLLISIVTGGLYLLKKFETVSIQKSGS